MGKFSLWLLVFISAFLAGVSWFYAFSPQISAAPGQTSTADGSNPEPIITKQITPATNPTVKPKIFVPILMYHYIRDYQNPDDPLGNDLSVSPVTFAAQLHTLKSAGYQTIRLADFADGLPLPAKPIILTFDDGYDDHFNAALPALQQEGMIGTFFIVKNFLNLPRYLTTAQLQEMKDAGMELGGHSLSHRNLATTPYDLAKKEIGQSLRGRDSVFAYPSGRYTSETQQIMAELAVKAGVTTNNGVATDLSAKFELPRIRVKEKTDLLKVVRDEIYLTKNPPPASQAPNL